MSADGRIIDRLFWRAWTVSKRMERAVGTQERREAGRYLESIEDELERFLCQIARSDREQLRLW